MNKYYAGIGSRKTPKHVQRVMMYIAKELSQEGYTLRSGGAFGADQAFQRGVLDNKAQIWLPWVGFEKEFTDQFPDHDYKLPDGIADKEALDSVQHFHPNYKNMEKGDPKKFNTFMSFMSRNYRQVKGLREPNSEFVIYWTDGDLGGTGQALRIAKHYDIPTFNLLNMTKDDIFKEIKKLHLLY